MNRHRTTADYLKALSIEAGEVDYAAIVVGFERETRFIWSASPDVADRLEALLMAGGRPVAILGATVAGNAFHWRLDPFEEYAQDEGTRNYLAAIGNAVTRILEQRLAAASN